MAHSLDRLMTHFAPWLAETPQADVLTRLLQRDRRAAFTEPSSPCPHPELLAMAVGSAPTPLIEAITELTDHLTWFHPPPEVPEVMRSHACAAEFIGPDGVIRRDDLRFGIMAVAPNIDYPAHRHAADEIYFVVAGSAEWTLDGHTQRAATGSVVVTPSLTSHAIVTADEPLLTIYSWTGDISFDSYEMVSA